MSRRTSKCLPFLPARTDWPGWRGGSWPACRILLLIVLPSYICVSCASHTPPETRALGCDEQARNWVEQNRPLVAKLTRTELLKLPVEYHRVVYCAMPTSGKYAVWKAKLDEVYEMSWTSQQLQQIDLLRLGLSEEWFEPGSDTGLAFGMQWIERNEGLFNPLEVQSILATVRKYPLVDFRGAIGISPGGPPTQIPVGDPDKQNCECSQGSDFCGIPFIFTSGATSSCVESACEESPDGCGLWWQSPCDGMCDIVINYDQF